MRGIERLASATPPRVMCNMITAGVPVDIRLGMPRGLALGLRVLLTIGILTAGIL